jgi:hypothetical protein
MLVPQETNGSCQQPLILRGKPGQLLPTGAGQSPACCYRVIADCRGCRDCRGCNRSNLVPLPHGALNLSFLKNGGLAIEVSDTGIGIVAEDIPKAMASFGQIESKISRKHEGSGLGLPLPKHLVELHGGTLTIESQVNVGTTVTVMLPDNRIVLLGPPVTAIRALG